MDKYQIMLGLSYSIILITIVPPIAIRLLYALFSQISNSQSLNTKSIIKYVLDKNNMTHFRVEENYEQSELTNYFDPDHEIISLNSKVSENNSIASLAITLHEIGHALQYKEEWTLYKIRNVIIPMSEILMISSAVSIVLTFGLKIFVPIALVLTILALGCYIIEIPVEINASYRAIKIMKNDLYVPKSKIVISGIFLAFCSLTYVATAIQSVYILLGIIGMIINPPEDEEDKEDKK